MNLAQVNGIATRAHHGQVDKIGVPYVEHVRAVAAGLVHFPIEVQIAGLLHDVVEDTDLTLEDLRRMGIPGKSLHMIDAVTKLPGMTKDEQIQKVINGGWGAILVKISDNAHNTRPDRVAFLEYRRSRSLQEKYRIAREKLWREADYGDVEKILKIVNPALVGDLSAFDRAPRPDISTEEVAAMYMNGDTVLDISVEFNCSPGAIVARLKLARKSMPELPWVERDNKKAKGENGKINKYARMNDGKPGDSRMREGSVIRGRGGLRRGL